jgi:hypothetical protein
VLAESYRENSLRFSDIRRITVSALQSIDYALPYLPSVLCYL